VTLTADIERPTKPLQMVDVVGQYRRYKQEIDEAVLAVMQSGSYINGPVVRAFEEDMSRYLGVRHAIACASGTDALQLAMMAIGITGGDEVLTTPFTFVATTETIALLGAKPTYADIDRNTFNIDPDEIRKRIGPRTRALLPVHLFGQACDLSAVSDLAKSFGLYLIEDAAQGIGASFGGRKACTVGDISCISFYPSKNLGAFGDAGMMTTDDDTLAEKLRSIANHGANKTYYHDRLGVNSRLDAMQAAILRVKLKYLDEWNARRSEVTSLYTEIFAEEPELIQPPFVHANAVPIWHQYSLLIKADRQNVMSALREDGVPTNVYYPVPLHLQPAYQLSGGKAGDFPNAEYASEHILALPMHSELTDSEVEYIAKRVIARVREFRS
jgi:UDP-2-acetamido-2-deoxy-ribo-hexuluronate aminotransferase